MQGIYKITNLINNKIYIGKTNNSERRWRDHQRLAMTEGHKEYNKVLYQAIRKYGIENFSFEMIEELEDYSVSEEREKYWISFYNSYNNGYNESKGGDGGSEKGHCQGTSNGRALLTEEDVIKIRTLYKNGISRAECYSLFKDKITESGFGRIWLGQTWSHIMPEVYTKENKKRNESLGKASPAKKRRLFNEEQVKEIRRRRDNLESNSIVYLDYANIASKSSFDGIWYNRTYKEI